MIIEQNHMNVRAVLNCLRTLRTLLALHQIYFDGSDGFRIDTMFLDTFRRFADIAVRIKALMIMLLINNAYIKYEDIEMEINVL
ncbi:hypothetical protein X777_01704 [Ooceraea biroi]|uniref:Uncharacterized protein n=1 Tax=Ooceraea biroi TaxID=2015173 RepID=A0A026WME9_OOCBI|nr:hypothetical protein X777_01704 [Ooceraea biroi]